MKCLQFKICRLSEAIIDLNMNPYDGSFSTIIGGNFITFSVL